ncbi:nose resistant to fluoxetine protein 6 [Scaptodrosophila lebanonensis]|uniref:Nose resistant to fluoxetine protein 6 n=1 Tax=Drosophila lebanonensis TaxID=7225 RepID=A0A6J2UFF0_DROLE|nr:nose resistant to fluoxetine protein 6 [Scaptodrosophila lebanonensis]
MGKTTNMAMKLNRKLVWVVLLISLELHPVPTHGVINDSYYSPSVHSQQYVHNLLNGTNTMHTEVQVTKNTELEPDVMETTKQWSKSSTNEAYLIRSSVLFGLTKVANQSNVNDLCHVQLKHIQRSILDKQPWAMKVLDASGSKPAGFIFGNNFWLGSPEACRGIQRPVGITLSKNMKRVMNYGIITDKAPFDMDYRVIYLSHSSPWQVEIKLMSEQIIHIGLCLPTSCDSEEIKHLTSDYVEHGMSADNEIYEIRPEVVYMKDLKLRNSFYQRTSFKIVIASIIATCAFIFCAQQLREREREAMPAKKLADDSTSGLAPAEWEFWRAFDAVLADPKKFTRFKDFVRCFDVLDNWEKIFTIRDNRADEIPVINGLRSVCAYWIMIFHVMWFMYFTVHNKTVLISYAEKLGYQYVSSAPLLVDVFFTISGFLQTYNFIRNAKQTEAIRNNDVVQNLKLFGKLLFHRYLRLGPLYLIVIGVVDLLFVYIRDVSIYNVHERFDETCAQHWWRNLLFIQNLFPITELCVNWSWSLACDMQFFVLATILLFVYTKRPKVAKTVVAVVLLATIAWSLVIGIKTKYEFSFDVVYETGSYIYISPFVRVLPYIVGAIAAWCLVEHKLQYNLSEAQERWLWNLSILVFFICLYSTFKRDFGYIISISLFVLGRFIFSVCICWMIVGSARGRGVWWSRLLESKGFQHLNRQSYAIYLLNPLVIAFFYGLTNGSTHADPFILFVITFGFAVIVYLASIVFSLCYELPYTNLSSQLLKRNGKLKSA